jgi:hypothetical protein
VRRRPRDDARDDAGDEARELALGPTSGLLTGWIGEAIAAAVALTGVLEHHGLESVRVVLGALLGGALVWSFLLRSRVVLRTSEVLLRNVYVDTAIPYTLVDRFVVRSVTHVFVGGKRYVGSGVGRSARSMIRKPRARGAFGGVSGGLLDAAPAASTATKRGSADVADFLEEQVADRVGRARDWAGAPVAAGGEVRRSVAWPELAVTVVLAAAFVVSLVV